MLGTWEKRPTELRSLFNPAFCGVLIAVAVKEYEAEQQSGMPFLMAHLLLPITLHAETRDAFPATTHTSLTHWITLVPQFHIGFPERVQSFRSITTEGIRFAIAGGILKLNASGQLIHVPRRPRGTASVSKASTEVAACFKVAKNLGRWFARVPDIAFLFQLLRIRP
jgi:hypothetical protein